MPRCISKCKGIDENECTPQKQCRYVNKTRKYCRLDYAYKMNKPACNVTLRKNAKNSAVVQNPVNNANADKARGRISRFIKSSKLFLNKICPTSGACITFGNNVELLTDYFKGFTGFEYVVSPIKRIGKPSANGFIRELEYNRNGYKAHAVLKSSQKPSADNLVYEYIVGTKLINRVLKIYPCFLQTYGLYYYNTLDDWNLFKKTKVLDKDNLQRLTLQRNIDYEKACTESKFASILIQHVHNATSINDMLDDADKTSLNNDLLYIVFILYHALSSMATKFTHYDLHTGNVLLYKPKDGHYIEYHYHCTDGKTYTFCCPYVPKIIDYGRCYFNNGRLNGRTIYDKVCATQKCKPKCGSNKGFLWLNPVPRLAISASKKNESHDLRLLNTIQKYIKHASPLRTFRELMKVVDNVMYGVGQPYRGQNYGTNEMLGKENEDTVYNVTSAFIKLKAAISKADVMQENRDRYTPQIKLGELHVYSNGQPMKYVHSVRV
jgi:hypothetical protein